ncbi:hypothetical protein Ddye_029684 [Dipteronia dyeriana]|uniref:Uncharacterized protein n=1 Tax=Dipteronia dyeriana TaxID=168575 RepID=A0AAD9WLR6_9ROSI|nr:hypothetical protein Ddye_029684 [Dipteronia dyeriana]
MAASLQQLLKEDGFENGKLSKIPKQVKLKDRVAPDDSVALPIYICRDLKSFDFSKQKPEKDSTRKGSSVVSSKRVGLGREEPPIDEVAIRAVISILSGYIGRYVKDENFRQMVKDKFSNCLVMRRSKDSDNGILANMELGVENIDKLVKYGGTTKKELRLKFSGNSIQLLSIVASLNSKKSRHNSTCGISNSHLSAFAQLYLAILYKLEKNDRISARHLLQVFCDSPFLARTHLLPDLWEHFFLPHLLHLKVWYHKEVEFLSNLQFGEKEKRIKALSKVYNDQMDMGTTQFAVYYKQWLQIGVKAPAVPTVPLPSRPSYGSSRRRSSDSYASCSSTSNNLYQAVFGPTSERRSRSMDMVNPDRALTDASWGLDEDTKLSVDIDNYDDFNYVQNKMSYCPRPYQVELRPETQKLGVFRFFTCQDQRVQTEFLLRKNSTRYEDKAYFESSELSRAISSICSSDSLIECEFAIRVIAKAWLSSRSTEAELSKASLIEGMLEVLFASNNDEILELTTSLLAEIISRNDLIRQIILNSDPQLEIFIRLLRSSSLFLKSAVLLYLLKPKAKQMISTEWVPLVLRVLEFGDSLQTLFTVSCSAQAAAFYFLDQLVNGFDEDKNLENAREVVSLGGLGLLVGRFEKGEINDRNKAVSIILCCIRADESCKNYLAVSLNKASILELIAVENHKYSNGCAINLLAELLCLTRRTQIVKFLDGLNCGWGGFNTMHILLVYLQKAPPEEQPLVAAILLQLDLLGDPLKSSIYREEAVETIIAALDCQKCNEKVQKQSARALMMLGGHFSCSEEEAITGKWLLKQAGLHENSDDSFYCKASTVVDQILNEEEQEAAEIWQRRVAIGLVKNSNREGLLGGLANCIANGIPSLARASLFTVAWITNFLHSLADENLLSMASSILLPQLIQSSTCDSPLEDQMLASFSFQRLTATLGCVSILSSLDEDMISPL